MRRLLNLFKNINNDSSGSTWKLSYNWFKPAQEGLRETLCTLGNGYFASRGALAGSSASRIHYPGTYMAGVYNILPTNISGRTVFNEDMVNCPNWLYLTFRIGNQEWVSLENNQILSYNQELDMHKGVLSRKIRLRDSKGHISFIETQRFIHMGDPHRAGISYSITPENYEGWIVIRSGIDGTVQNTGVARYRQLNSKHLKPCSMGSFGKNGIYLCVKTSQSDIKISMASKAHIYQSGKEIKPASRILTKDKKAICAEFGLFARKRQRYQVDKMVSVYTSRDKGIRSHVSSAINAVKASHGYGYLLKTHKHAWDVLWKKFDIEIEGDSFSQRVLRLHLFHLIQTASPHNVNIDAGLPARGLHGEAYRGHIFWDELYVMPVFDLHAPEISKALLKYRHTRLPQARKYAHENGYKGSMFPWQSGSSGKEETQVIHLNPMSGKWDPDHSCIQRHISFAIAYNVWQFWNRTRDFGFMKAYGAEMLLSIAQFGSSLAVYNPKDGRYHTERIMGPDEFHEKLPGAQKGGFRDNAYTNVLIVWTLKKALNILKVLPDRAGAELLRTLDISQKELNRWGDITRKMNLIINNDGIIAQFEGYFKLKELNWEHYKSKYGNIHRMDRILKAEGKSPNDYKVQKQADVLMMFYLFSFSELRDLFMGLGYKIDKNMVRFNFDYYVKRTSHGSTLSKVVHCDVLHLLGKSRKPWHWFQDVLKSDIYDTQGGTTVEGIHAGVMGGSVNIVIKAFAGVEVMADRVKISPDIPSQWKSLKLKVLFRGHWISISATRKHLSIFIKGGTSRSMPVQIEVEGKSYRVRSGRTYKYVLKSE